MHHAANLISRFGTEVEACVSRVLRRASGPPLFRVLGTERVRCLPQCIVLFCSRGGGRECLFWDQSFAVATLSPHKSTGPGITLVSLRLRHETPCGAPGKSLSWPCRKFRPMLTAAAQSHKKPMLPSCRGDRFEAHFKGFCSMCAISADASSLIAMLIVRLCICIKCVSYTYTYIHMYTSNQRFVPQAEKQRGWSRLGTGHMTSISECKEQTTS